MIDDLRTDPMMRLVGSLERAAPDAARAEGIRARCRQTLQVRAARRGERPGRFRTVVGVLCAVYLAEIAWQAVGLWR
jgi:hypothetical protein